MLSFPCLHSLLGSVGSWRSMLGSIVFARRFLSGALFSLFPCRHWACMDFASRFYVLGLLTSFKDFRCVFVPSLCSEPCFDSRCCAPLCRCFTSGVVHFTTVCGPHVEYVVLVVSWLLGVFTVVNTLGPFTNCSICPFYCEFLLQTLRHPTFRFVGRVFTFRRPSERFPPMFWVLLNVRCTLCTVSFPVACTATLGLCWFPLFGVFAKDNTIEFCSTACSPSYGCTKPQTLRHHTIQKIFPTSSVLDDPRIFFSMNSLLRSVHCTVLCTVALPVACSIVLVVCWLDGGYVTQGVMRHRLGSGVPTRDPVVSKGVSSSTISGLLGARAPGVVTFGFLGASLPLAPSVALPSSLDFGPSFPPCWRSSCLLRVPPFLPHLQLYTSTPIHTKNHQIIENTFSWTLLHCVLAVRSS